MYNNDEGKRYRQEARHMSGRCPGQDGRNLRASIHRCPSCGGEVEMFSDETRVRCPHCREAVYKENVPSCVEWCAKARECLGEDRWRALHGDVKGGGEQNDG